MKLFIDGRREAYGAEDLDYTMTVGELMEYLAQYNKYTKVYLCNDNGYTYGSITDTSFSKNYDGEKLYCPDCDNEITVKDGTARCEECGWFADSTDLDELMEE